MFVVVSLWHYLFISSFCDELVELMDFWSDVLGDFWEGVCEFARGVWEWVRLADYLFWGIVMVLGIVGMVLAVVGR